MNARWIFDVLRAVRLRCTATAQQLAAWSNDAAPELAWPSEVLDAERQAASALAAAPDHPFARLSRRFDLRRDEQRQLWVLVAAELCPVVRHQLRELASDQLADPTTDVLRRVVYGLGVGSEAWTELGVRGTLRHFGLVERTDGAGDIPEHRQTWKVSRRVLALVHGHDHLDESVADLARIDAPPAHELVLPSGLVEELAAAVARETLVLVQGASGAGKRSALLAAVGDRRVLTIEGRALARETAPFRAQLRALARECRLFELVPLIRDLDALATGEADQDRIAIVESELPGLVLATSTRPIGRRWSRPPVLLEVRPLERDARARLWGRAIPAAAEGDAELLATMYPMAPALIDAAGRTAVAACGDEPMRPDHIEAALRTVLDDRLAGLARRVEVTQTWDDIVLPEEQTVAMIELLSRVRERARVYEQWGFARKLGKGLGVTALFSGPPGTGKTMAAGLVARSLRLDLYQVDLSKIVSKWIGETEKHLAALFDAAEAGHAILLFDEADALFGKRTEVRSSNDRHANQEVNFLLQRLESYSGICILTTNHENAIDEAFRRRLSVHVRFPMPDADERARLWRAMLPAEAPVEGELKLESLASTYVMTGGYIRNAVLRAAFLAADDDAAIDAGRLLRAAQLEYEALGKVFATRPS